MSSPVKLSFSDLYPLISEAIGNGETVSFTAHGRSMLPFIKDGEDQVTLSPIVGDLKKFDVVFYQRSDRSFVLHRIVGKGKNGAYLVCGDNQFIKEPVNKEQIIAKLHSVKRNEKTIPVFSPSYRIGYFLLPVRRLRLRLRSAIRRFLGKHVHSKR